MHRLHAKFACSAPGFPHRSIAPSTVFPAAAPAEAGRADLPVPRAAAIFAVYTASVLCLTARIFVNSPLHLPRTAAAGCAIAPLDPTRTLPPAPCARVKAATQNGDDNLFHTVLGLLNIETSVRDPALDLTAECRP